MSDNYQQARTLQDEGLAAELTGDFTTAHERFEGALQLVPPYIDDVEATALRADIARNGAFTYTREAAQIESHILALGILSMASEGLAFARRDIARLLGLDNLQHARLLRPITQHERTGLEANYGATIGLLGRTATVRAVVMEDSDLPGVEAEHAAARTYYTEAHSHLRRGNNGYYRVSNAMAGAREALLSGDRALQTVWLGRALFGLAWTRLRDPANLEAAQRTFQSRREHLHGYRAARSSVRQKP